MSLAGFCPEMLQGFQLNLFAANEHKFEFFELPKRLSHSFHEGERKPFKSINLVAFKMFHAKMSSGRYKCQFQ